jgi:hypothetical protein
VQWVLVLSGTIEDMDKARVEAIMTHLHQLSEDMTLTIQKIEEGSVKLIIESTEEGFKRIKALYRGADLHEVAGRSILEIRDAQSLVRTRMAQENPSSSMPKSTKKSRNPDDDPAVLAARINRSGTIRNGFIAAAAGVLVAIVGLTNRFCDQQPKPGSDKEKLVIKVLDKTTGRSIGGAKVSLEGGDVPPVNTTDSNGVISFPISNPKKELRIRIDADGYEKDFNLRITPASIIGTPEVRLTPLASPSPGATAAITTQPFNPAPHRSPFPTRVPIKSESNRLVIRGLVMDEAGATLPGARVAIAGHGSTTTDASGNFQIAITGVSGRTIYLNVAKEGYRTRTLEEQASDDAIQIVLRR